MVDNQHGFCFGSHQVLERSCSVCSIPLLSLWHATALPTFDFWFLGNPCSRLKFNALGNIFLPFDGFLYYEHRLRCFHHVTWYAHISNSYNWFANFKFIVKLIGDLACKIVKLTHNLSGSHASGTFFTIFPQEDLLWLPVWAPRK